MICAEKSSGIPSCFLELPLGPLCLALSRRKCNKCSIMSLPHCSICGLGWIILRQRCPLGKENSCFSKCHGHHGERRRLLGSVLILSYSWGIIVCLMPGCLWSQNRVKQLLESFSWGLGHSSVVKCLPGMCKTLSSISGSIKNEQKSS